MVWCWLQKGACNDKCVAFHKETFNIDSGNGLFITNCVVLANIVYDLQSKMDKK